MPDFGDSYMGNTVCGVRNMEENKEVYKNEIWKNDKTFLVALVAYLVVLLLFIIMRVVSGSGLLSDVSDQAVEAGFSIVSQAVIMLLVPLLAIKLFARPPQQPGFDPVIQRKTNNWSNTLGAFGFNKTSWKVIGFAFLLGVLLYFFNIFVAGFFNSILLLLGFRFPLSNDLTFPGIWGFFISLALIAVLPGLCEETNHRGMLLNSFVNKLGVWRAVLLSSLLFGLMHMNIVQFFYAAILGYLIAQAVLATRSIWTGVIMHFMNNAISTYVQYARAEGWFLGNALEYFLGLFDGAFGFLLLFAFVFGIYWLINQIIHKFAKENYTRNEKVFLANILKNNPNYVSEKTAKGESVSLEDMSRQINTYLASLGKHDAVRFYLDTHEKPASMTVLERTFLFGVIFLGAITTIMTLVWGLL